MIDAKKLFVISNADFTQDVMAKISSFLCSAPLAFKDKIYFVVPYSERYEVAEQLGALLA